jgi:hypothetical protein
MFLCSERNTWDVGRTLEKFENQSPTARDSQTFLVFSQQPKCFSQSTTWKSDFKA